MRQSIRQRADDAGAINARGRMPVGPSRATPRVGAPHATTPDAIRAILTRLLVVEQLLATFYYTALTTPAVLRDRRLAGRSADLRHPGLPPDGYPAYIHDLQAALDAEVKHAAALARAGAIPWGGRFYFPATTFRGLGSPRQRGTCLGVLDTLETACIGAYIAAAERFVDLTRPDLALVAARVMGVEAEHVVLGHVLAGITPVHTLAVDPAAMPAIDDADAALRPFLTGMGFHAEVIARAVPTAPQAARVIGPYGTHIVPQFQWT